MVPDDRSTTGGSTFDFNSQAGVLVVLGAIRASSLGPVERNELRDLVFLYSNGGGDAAVRTVLEERLREAGITPATIPAKTVATVAATVLPKSTSGFATGRPTPVFAVSTAQKVAATPVVPTASVPVRKIVTEQKVEIVPKQVVQTPVAPRVVPVVTEPLDVPIPAKEIPPPPRPVAVKVAAPVTVPPRPVVVVPTPVSVKTIAPSIPPPPVVSTVQPVSVQTTDMPTVEAILPATTARLERIRAIKSDVNNRVGNPVNLVAMDKAVGSEYMSALLEAMKLLSSASDIESSRAMTRLEMVYTQVQSLLEKTATSSPVPASVQVAPVSVEKNEPEPAAIVVPHVDLPVEPATTWGQSEEIINPVPTIPARSVSMNRIDPLPSAADAAVRTSVSRPQQSVAVSQVPLRSITELPTADEVNSKSETGDPLFTKEVDAGLQQLLSEWMLFKKSGLFGAGPNGREHPLYIKLAPLQLALLLAGRFEGSTQDIKQSVTDYMNGWRYEQGIVYEKDETFEHYLRRVIRHIIDLQNKKRSA